MALITDGYVLPATAQGSMSVSGNERKELLPVGKWAGGNGVITDSLVLFANGTFLETSFSILPEKKEKSKLLVVKKASTGDWTIKSGTEKNLVLSLTWIEAGSKVLHEKQLPYSIRKDQLSDLHRY